LIANPDYLRDKDNGCINAMKCHYYSRGEAHLTCGRWEKLR
jgi:NADPH2 dehydrogenase